jgi:hypothetical protein
VRANARRSECKESDPSRGLDLAQALVSDS